MSRRPPEVKSLTVRRAEEFGVLLDQPMPSAPDAERAIIGAIILNNTLMEQVMQLLRPDDFYVRAHYLIYQAMVKLFQSGSEINPILLGDELKVSGHIQLVGGVAFISELTYGLPHFTNVAAYAKKVRGKAKRRNFISSLNESVLVALKEDTDDDEALRNGESIVLATVSTELRLGQKGRGKQLVPVIRDKEEMRQHLGRMHRGESSALPTGIRPFDNILEGGGLQPQGVYLFAARPKAGKTSLVLGIAHRIARTFQARKMQRSVGMFSLEMRRLALQLRLFSGFTQISFSTLSRPGLRGNDYHMAMRAVDDFYDGLPMLMADDVYTIPEMWQALNRAVTGPEQLGMAVIDYLQLMSAKGQSGEVDLDQQTAEVTYISRQVKHMAQEFNIPIIGISSMNRAGFRQPMVKDGGQKRRAKRGELYDLRGSGMLEYDAEMVAFLSNPEYVPGMSDEEMQMLNAKRVWDIDVQVAAQRNGPTDDIRMKFLRQYMLFLTPDEYAAQNGGPSDSFTGSVSIDERFE